MQKLDAAPQSPLDFIAEAYWEDLEQQRPIDGGALQQDKLQALYAAGKLDESVASLNELDALLAQVGANNRLRPDMFMQDSRNRAFMLFVAFYVGRVLAKALQTPVTWLGQAKLQQDYPQLSIHPNNPFHFMALDYQLDQPEAASHNEAEPSLFFVLEPIAIKVFGAKLKMPPVVGDSIAPSLMAAVIARLPEAMQKQWSEASVKAEAEAKALKTEQVNVDDAKTPVTALVRAENKKSDGVKPHIVTPKAVAVKTTENDISVISTKTTTIQPDIATIQSDITTIQPDIAAINPMSDLAANPVFNLAAASANHTALVSDSEDTSHASSNKALSNNAILNQDNGVISQVQQINTATPLTDSPPTVSIEKTSALPTQALKNPVSLVANNRTTNLSTTKKLVVKDSFQALRDELENIDVVQVGVSADTDAMYQRGRQVLLQFDKLKMQQEDEVKQLGDSEYQMRKRALAVVKKAAEAGHTGAMLMLAIYLFKGEGVKQDDGLGIVWVKKSAEAGDIRAQRQLSRLYYQGMGVEQDMALGKHWLEKAAENGHVEAGEVLSSWAMSQAVISEKKEEEVTDQRYLIIIGFVIFIILLIVLLI